MRVSDCVQARIRSAFIYLRSSKPVGETRAPKSKGNHRSVTPPAFSFVRSSLRAGVAPSLARWCSWGVRWSACHSSAVRSSPHRHSVAAALFVVVAAVVAPSIWASFLAQPVASSSVRYGGCGRVGAHSCAFGGW